MVDVNSALATQAVAQKTQVAGIKEIIEINSTA
jgi:hypothetical protein